MSKKTKSPQVYGPWICDACGDSDGVGGVVIQSSKTKAVASRCRYCGPKVSVTRLPQSAAISRN